jgi:anti-sigma28 factor (negative regulator of flagellin synthesis)
MQVYRLHSSEPVASPVTSRGGDGSVNATSSGTKDTQEGVSAEAGSGISALLAQLQRSPDVRQAVVEQARGRIASGDYFTRTSAEATAEALLRNES